MATETILSEVSPNGNLDAYVEQDERVTYFYLQGTPETNFGLRSCWVRNLQPAPEKLHVEDMRNGIAPLLPRNFCRYPQGSSAFSKTSELRFVWFEEGNAAALLSKGDVLAVIPPWSGQSDFNGYARDCIGESPLCWQLGVPQENVLLDRIWRAEEAWAAWDNEPTTWSSMQEQFCQALEIKMGPANKYYAIDGGEWPPKAMLRFQHSDCLVLSTVGVSLRPQPNVEMFADEPQKLRRIELGICLDADISESEIRAVMGYVSGQAGFPWHFYTWLGPYHTIPCDVFAAAGFPGVLLMSDPVSAPNIQLPDYRNDPVTLLWMVPITAAERKYATEEGGEALAAKLRAAEYGWIHQKRRQVSL